MAQFGCGGARCSCVVTAGPGVTVTGNGSSGAPYVIGAGGGGTVTCDQVRPCLSAGDGIDYDPATGTIGARPSTDAGNTLDIGTDGGLLVPGPEALTTACGLTGDGSASTPLAAAVMAWPHPCDLDANASGVYCDSDGALRGEPPVRSDFFQNAKNQSLATPMPVPTASDQPIDTLTLTVTNPDPCRPAWAILFREVDLDLNLPPGSGGMAGIDGDDMSYLGNQGSGTVFNTHTQDNKITQITLAPGETQTITMNITSGRGSGGAEITRIQATLRAWLFSIPQG
ncbi:hypothetical protein ACWEQC_22260 [Streptomyces shenzhenensis]